MPNLPVILITLGEVDKGQFFWVMFCIILHLFFFSSSVGLIVMDALAQFTKLVINGQSSWSVC